MYKHDVHLILAKPVRSPFIMAGFEHFSQKLGPYMKLHLHEPKHDRAFYEKCKKLKKDAITIVCDEKGRQYTSLEFSKKLEPIIHQRAKDICFIIGGPVGFHRAPRARSKTFSIDNDI